MHKLFTQTAKRHKLFNVNSKENSVLCGYLLQLYNINIDMSQVIPETKEFLLIACHSCTSLVKGIIKTEKKMDSLKNELHDIKRIGLLEIFEQSCLVTNTLEN